MQHLLERYQPLREGEGAGAGGAGQGSGTTPAAGAGQGSGAPPAGGNANSKGGGAGPAPYYPAGMADHFKGSDDRGTIDALHTAMAGMREKLNGLPDVPKAAKDYKIEFSPELVAKVGDLSSDPLMKKVPELAHKAGLGQKQLAAFLPVMLETMAELGAFAKQPNDDDLVASMIDPALAGAARDEAMQAQRKALTDARAWVSGLKDGYSDDARAEALIMTNSKGGLELLTRLMANGTNGVVPGGVPPAAMTAQELARQRMKDPRNQYGSSQFDPAFAAETERQMRLAFPG